MESEARELAATGMKITAAANEQLGFTHPENAGWDHISFCAFAGPVFVENGERLSRSAVAIRPGKIDRSPTGTALSARMAVMAARGQTRRSARGITLVSIIGSRFVGRIVREATVAGRPAVVPSISGRAWITGTHQVMLDPDDPWPQGYRLTDTWPALR